MVFGEIFDLFLVAQMLRMLRLVFWLWQDITEEGFHEVSRGEASWGICSQVQGLWSGVQD